MRQAATARGLRIAPLLIARSLALAFPPSSLVSRPASSAACPAASPAGVCAWTGRCGGVGSVKWVQVLRVTRGEMGAACDKLIGAGVQGRRGVRDHQIARSL